MATLSQQDLGQSSQQIQSNSNSPQNVDAYDGPTSPSNASDSKRSHAAQLARDLASSSSWSEAFMPQNHGEISSSGPPVHRSSITAANRSLPQDSNYSNSMNQDDLDPPPAYSNLPQVPELPATPVITMATPEQTIPPPQQTVPSRAGGIENDQDLEREEPDVEEPLLGRQQGYRDVRQVILWWWKRREKAAKRRRFKQCCCFIVTLIVAVTVICAIVVGTDKDPFSGSPARPSQSFVPTGPDYRRFETIQSITGAYKLYDRIELATTTGIIDIEIDPQPGDQPAFLILSSDLGSITMRLSPEYQRRRNRARRAIHTEIHSLTGSIAADILLGNGGAALIDTATGNQMVSVLTYDVGSHDDIANLTTYTKTGAQKVVLNSLDPQYKSITKIHAEHHGFATASLDINYPSNWLGEVHARVSPLGLLDVQGDDLEFTRSGDKEVVAHRGPSKNMQTVEVISDGTGTVSFKC